MYTLFIANKNYSSWSLRPWALMQELRLAFEERLTPFAEGSSWNSFRKFSPSGKVPCLIHDNEVIWDSLAITEYLAERHPTVWPADIRARTWARCATAEMHSGFTALRERCSMTCGVRVRLHEIPESLRRDLDRLSELWSEGLQRFGGLFLAGASFSAVDAFFAPVAFRVQTYGLQLDPTAQAYASRLLKLPSMRSWYADALAERWRDETHDAETRKWGTWLEDLRTKG
jgi:glutathione S-transferase